jgi:2-keto-myo-inositol isomerase
MTYRLSRRDVIASAGAGLGAATLCRVAPAAQPKPAADKLPLRFCLNTGTLMGFKLPITEEVEIAAKTGYSGIEPWLRSVQQHLDAGKSLKDLRSLIADRGLTVEGAIGFASWIVDDDAQRAKGVEQMKHDMDTVAQLGGRRIAAPPAGANTISGFDLRKAAERYHALLELGRTMGVLPQLEIWGGSKTLSRISEAATVAIEAGHPDACLLLDVFHIYKGGSSFDGLRILSSLAMHVFHVNDYPADPPARRPPTPIAFSRAMAAPRGKPSSATSAPWASAARCPWNSSTGSTGKAIRWKSPGRDWRRPRPRWKRRWGDRGADCQSGSV